MKNIELSIIIPVYNEQGNLQPLFEKIKLALSPLKKTWEIIFIDDGSRDDSVLELQTLANRHPEVKLLQFTRNFGQTSAFAAGFDHAQGDLVVTLDADLQNDPKDIPAMIDLMNQEKADIVAGWRKHRQDPFLRSLLSKVANKIIVWATGANIHDTGCSLRLYKHWVISDVKLYGEMHRFIPALAASLGAKLIEIPVSHHPRVRGQSKYGFTRTFKVILDLITVKFLSGFQTKPIYMFGFTGISLIILSGIIAIFVAIRALFWTGIWISPLFAIGASFFAFGIVFIANGLLAEIQVRSWYESTGKKNYILKKT